MKKLILILTSFLFLSPIVVFATAENKSSGGFLTEVSVKSGELLIDVPVSKLGDKISNNEYEVLFSDLNINNYLGVESDYEVNIMLNVFDREGNLKTSSNLTGNTILVSSEEINPDFENVSVQSGAFQTLVSNNSKTHFNEIVFKYENLVISGIEDGDKIEITFQIKK